MAVEEPVVAAPVVPAAGEAAPAAIAPVAGADAAPVAPGPEGAAIAPAGETAPAAAPGADAAPAKAAPEFAPSLLDEAAKPTADAKPEAAPDPAKEPAKDAAKEEAKPPAQKEPAPAPEATAPIEYAFKYPDGVKPEELDSERMGAFTGILNDSRVPAEAGQKLLDLHLGEVARVAEQLETTISTRQWDVFNTQQKAWREAVMADPEIGGSRHETALRTVMTLVDAYGNRFQDTKNARDAEAIAAERKGLMDVFRTTGAANSPLILGLLHFAGEKLREGSARPAPTPRVQTPNAQNRGLRRYQGSSST